MPQALEAEDLRLTSALSPEDGGRRSDPVAQVIPSGAWPARLLATRDYELCATLAVLGDSGLEFGDSPVPPRWATAPEPGFRRQQLGYWPFRPERCDLDIAANRRVESPAKPHAASQRPRLLRSSLIMVCSPGPARYSVAAVVAQIHRVRSAPRRSASRGGGHVRPAHDGASVVHRDAASLAACLTYCLSVATHRLLHRPKSLRPTTSSRSTERSPPAIRLAGRTPSAPENVMPGTPLARGPAASGHATASSAVDAFWGL
jgi:hypothetical protein